MRDTYLLCPKCSACKYEPLFHMSDDLLLPRVQRRLTKLWHRLWHPGSLVSLPTWHQKDCTSCMQQNLAQKAELLSIKRPAVDGKRQNY